MLAETGVRFPLPAALDTLAAHGAIVDRLREVARLPRPLVEAALAAAPPTFALCGRDPACDLPLDGRHTYLSNDASGVFVIDPASGERRASTLADVATSARFCDALPEVAFAWGPIVAAGDAPPGSRPLHEAAAVFANTGKHFQAVTCVGERATRLLVEMAAALAGGAGELRRRPLLSLIACPVDPLGNDAVSLEAGLVCAAAGVPCGFLSLTLGCGTAPASLAGNLVVNAATVLADLVLLQLASPGAPVFFASAPSVMDLRTGGYTGGGPEDDVLAAAATQLGHSFGLPVNMGAMATGAREPGWQAAVDDALSMATATLAGADMLSGCGLLDGSRTLSYEHLVMELEVYRMVRHSPGASSSTTRRSPSTSSGASATAAPIWPTTTRGATPASSSADRLGPLALRRLGRGRPARRARRGRRDRRPHPRRAPTGPARRRACSRARRHRGARRRRSVVTGRNGQGRRGRSAVRTWAAACRGGAV